MVQAAGSSHRSRGPSSRTVAIVGDSSMRQDRDRRAPCRTYVLVGTVVLPPHTQKTDLHVQRGRPQPGQRLFRSATSRTRAADATPAGRDQEPPIVQERATHRSRAPEASRWSARRTNDVDMDKRCRTVASLPDRLLTTGVIAGRHQSALVTRAESPFWCGKCRRRRRLKAWDLQSPLQPGVMCSADHGGFLVVTHRRTLTAWSSLGDPRLRRGWYRQAACLERRGNLGARFASCHQRAELPLDPTTSYC
jgi:hypothetical protein